MSPFILLARPLPLLPSPSPAVILLSTYESGPIFLLGQFVLSFHRWVESCSIFLSLTALFYLASWSPGPCTLLKRIKFSSLSWPSSIPLCKCPLVVLSTHLLMNMVCSHILAIVNNAAMNIGVLMFIWIRVLGSFKYISRSGIAGSKGKSIFNFSRYLQTAFHSGYTNLYLHQ